MLKSLIKIISCLFILITAFSDAACIGCGGGCGCDPCIQTSEIGIGWRRDDVDWRARKIIDSTSSDRSVAASLLRFDEVDMWVAHAKTKWIGEAYYIRLSAEYGKTFKGKTYEDFAARRPFFLETVDGHVELHMKRRNEAFDFTGAVGYPLLLCYNRLTLIPTIGFSYHRQLWSVRYPHVTLSVLCPSPETPLCDKCCHDLPDFVGESTTRSSSDEVFDPFDPNESTSDIPFAALLGFPLPFRSTNAFRFIWYGPFIGVDAAYAVDETWSLFTELEWHVYCNCHRRRKSFTGLEAVDHYHKQGRAYGLNGTIGTGVDLGTCWYTTINVDFKWWKSYKTDKDRVSWRSIGAHITLGYTY
jgi:hypothetical protein